MSDETLDLELESDFEADEAKKQQDRALKRNKDLSDKLKAEAEAKAQAEAEREQAKKEAEFYKGFNTMISKYPQSSELQDKIKEKVMAGYDIEDATVSILNKEGKFVPQEPPAPPASPAGGSATNTITQPEDKTPENMSLEEKRQALMDNDAELRRIISPRIGG